MDIELPKKECKCWHKKLFQMASSYIAWAAFTIAVTNTFAYAVWHALGTTHELSYPNTIFNWLFVSWAWFFWWRYK